MESVKINRHSAVYQLDELDIVTMMEVGERLLVVFKNDIFNRVGVGSKMFFKRDIYTDNDAFFTLEDNVEVLEKTTYKYKGKTYNAVYTTIPAEKRLKPAVLYNTQLNFVNNSAECRSDFDAYFDEVHHYLVVYSNGSFHVEDWLYYYGGDEQFFIIEFEDEHNIFQQDIFSSERNGGYSMSVQTAGGSRIGTIEGVSIPFTGLPYTVEQDDTLTTWEEETCGKFDSRGRTYKVIHHKYTHSPSSFSRNRIKFTSVETSQVSGGFYEKATYLISHGTWFIPKFNPYYQFYFNGTDKICSLWADEWWGDFDSRNGSLPITEIWENSGNTRSVLGIESAYWNIPSIAVSSDRADIGVEEDQMGSYVDEIIDSTIPDFVDMERVKYIPVIGNFEKIVTAITFDFHFRKREEVGNTEEDGYPKYNDKWNISEVSGVTSWWNGMEYYGTAFNASAFNDFINARGKDSDMLGYLNFVDEDIYYRKSRVSMSFIRMSFYSSKDPIEQKLLYYSTSFLDATSLYGKYMKQYVVKSEGEDDGLPIVFYDNNIVSARLDTEIVIRNEYQSEKSSEGFNLYLFADDADGVNSERTIYMKVEFNHAGNGKTIPMIMWPKSGGSYKALTADNFIDSLYIPIKIGYINGKYVYSIPDAEVEGNNLRLILFEPKLDYFAAGDNESDTGYDEVEYNNGRRENAPTRRTPIPIAANTE